MKFLSIVVVATLVFIIARNCVFAKSLNVEKYIFKNGRGEVIVITTGGAIIKGGYYSAQECSIGGVECVKYGSMFAIIVPLSCDAIDNYKWRGKGVESFIMALSPHDPSDVLLSTNYGGFVSFGYHGKDGVNYLFYDPSIRIGTEMAWHSIDHVDLDKVRYKKISGGNMFPCS